MPFPSDMTFTSASEAQKIKETIDRYDSSRTFESVRDRVLPGDFSAFESGAHYNSSSGYIEHK